MKKKTALISFFMAFVMFLIVAIFRGLYPFGKNTMFVFYFNQQA